MTSDAVDGRGFLCRNILIMIVVGLAVRLVLGFLLTYTFDVHSWALIIGNFESGEGLYDQSGYNYTPPWGYVLGTFSVIAEFLGLDVFGERFTEAFPVEGYDGWFFSASVPSVAFALSVKLMFFICDIAVGYLIYWIVRERTGDQRRSEIGFALWFLCPFVIAVGAIGGMFDTIVILMTLLCVVFVMRDRFLLAGLFIGAAALMKIFPGVLVFVLIAYVLLKTATRSVGVRNVAIAVIGAVVAVVVLLIPQILDGTLDSVFGFLISRAGDGMGTGNGSIITYASTIVYVVILILSIVIARGMVRRGGDPDRALLTMLLLNTAVLFLYPSTPQYILLMAPFLIIQIVLSDRKYVVPYTILAVGTTLFSLGGNATFLLSVSGFTDLIDMGSVVAATDWFLTPMFLGVSPVQIVYYTGGVLQYLGTLATLWTYIRVEGLGVFCSGFSRSTA